MAGIERDWQIEFMRVQPPIFLGPEAVLGYPNYDEGWRRDGLERRCDVARSKCDWRADPIEAYADLFHPFPDDPGVAEASPECGAGWADLLERACARIRTAVQVGGDTFKFTQIKEKYATIRLDWEGALSCHSACNIAPLSRGIGVQN